MPILPNPRHERFARELAQGKPACDAYVAAGYKANSGNASVLKADKRISKRVEELLNELNEIHGKAKEKAAERASVTVESLLGELDEAQRLAASLGQAAAVIAAIREKGVLSGKRIERRESGEPGEFAFIESLDAEELRALIVEGIAPDSLCEVDPAPSGGTRGPRGSLN